MESRVKILGHPAHQMLVPFPFGLLATAVLFDIAYLVTGHPALTIVSYWMMIAGIIGAVIAAPFGTVDFLAIPRATRAKSIAMLHGLGNVVVLVLFVISGYLRMRRADMTPAYEPTGLAFGLALVGFGLAAITGWLGGELVDRLGIGVDDGANVNAPSSLSRRSAVTVTRVQR